MPGRAFCCFIILSLYTGDGFLYGQISTANAQGTAARENIIFQDDFSSDTIGKFPSKWRLYTGGLDSSEESMQYCRVEKDGIHFMLSVSSSQDRSGLHLTPCMNDHLLPENINIECDFAFENKNAFLTFSFCSHPSKNLCDDAHLFTGVEKNIVAELTGWKEAVPNKKGVFPGPLDLSTWHHIKIAFYNGTITDIIDQRTLISAHSSYVPCLLHLSLRGPLKLRNFRITTTDTFEFGKILTENKFVTNAILFDVNQSKIKPASLGFITKLAAFLKANPGLKLEIGGHTDNDGNAELNLTLSQARADEVKKQLIASGIKESRLIAKGYGDTKPLKPNNTARGKAENRRVEFIQIQDIKNN